VVRVRVRFKDYVFCYILMMAYIRPAGFLVVSARQHRLYAIVRYAIARRFVCLSVCHTGGSVKNG